MSRKICVITGTRAEYGLLRALLQGVRDDTELELQLVVTGMHLSPEFGTTYKEIESDGFHITRKVEMLLSSDTASGIGKAVGLGVIGFSDVLADLQPSLIVVLGDRFEILSAVVAALFSNIPILHLHGGEVTEGSVDESTRHAISKMAHVHCVATEEYRSRVIQLGEQPERVHCVGGMGVDAIKQTKLLGRRQLEGSLDFKLLNKNLLITFHPETLLGNSSALHFNELLAALAPLEDTGLIFTLPNADKGGRELIVLLQQFVESHPNARAYPSLGQQRYLSCMALCDGVIGNSSSALLEAPTLSKGSINIGDRQRGRLQASSVINCRAERAEIGTALQTLFSQRFQLSLSDVINPYGDGGACARILRVIKDLDLEKLLVKPFFDLPAIASAPRGAVR